MSLNLDLDNIDSKYSLSVNLEEVSNNDEESNIISEQLLNNLVSALGLGVAVESVINARILEDKVEEARSLVKTVVRHGHLTRKTVCPEGFKVSGSGGCDRMTSRDSIAFQRRAKKAARTRKRHVVSPRSLKLMRKSLVIRNRNETKVNRVTPGR
jgi:hypothetical protein